MEKVYSFILLGIVGTIIVVVLKRISPEYSRIAAIVLGIIIGVYVLGQVTGIFDLIKSLAEKANINTEWIKSIFKICLVSFLGQWGTQICRDAGENAIADKLEIGVGITVVIICQPYFLQLINIAAELE